VPANLSQLAEYGETPRPTRRLGDPSLQVAWITGVRHNSQLCTSLPAPFSFVRGWYMDDKLSKLSKLSLLEISFSFPPPATFAILLTVISSGHGKTVSRCRC